MNISLRLPLTVLIAALVVTFALTGCEAVEEGVEAGQMAVATLDHMATEADQLLGEQPADAAAAKMAVAGAVESMASEAEYDPNITQAALVVIRGKVESWDLEGGQEIVDVLSDLENRLDAGEVEDVQAAIGDVINQLEARSMQ
jgi:hypothetical protein